MIRAGNQKSTPTRPMKQLNYNDRTLEAAIKRMNWILKPENEHRCPTHIELRWRFREGYRLQCIGEIHEPGGQSIMEANNRLGLERMLGAMKAMQDTQSCDHLAYTALATIIEQRPHEIGAQGLDHLSGAEDAPDYLRKLAAKAYIDIQ